MSSIEQWLTFNSIIIGYGIAYVSFLPWIHKHTKIRKRDPDALQPESRLYWLLWSKSIHKSNEILLTFEFLAAPLETIGLFGFAWTSLGPPHVHWIAPMIFSACIAIANVGHILHKTKVRELTDFSSTQFTWRQLITWLPRTDRIPLQLPVEMH